MIRRFFGVGLRVGGWGLDRWDDRDIILDE